MLLSAHAFGGTGDFGSVGGSRPASVVSTIDQIEVFNSQQYAMTMERLCETLSPKNPRLNWGKSGSKLTCFQTPEGLIELRAENKEGVLSIYANPTDKTVIEYFGSDEIHRYSNDQRQSLYIQLSFVNEKIRRTMFGVEEVGHYRPDIRLRSGNSSIRIGYYIQEFNP